MKKNGNSLMFAQRLLGKPLLYSKVIIMIYALEEHLIDNERGSTKRPPCNLNSHTGFPFSLQIA